MSDGAREQSSIVEWEITDTENHAYSKGQHFKDKQALADGSSSGQYGSVARGVTGLLLLCSAPWAVLPGSTADSKVPLKPNPARSVK